MVTSVISIDIAKVLKISCELLKKFIYKLTVLHKNGHTIHGKILE